MTIKEASQATGISADTLRYYERIGLIPPVPRTKSGIRNYDERSLRWINFAMKFKQAGVSLEKIIDYMKLAKRGESTRPARQEILLEGKADLERHIAEMTEFLKLINYKLEISCQCDAMLEELFSEADQPE